VHPLPRRLVGVLAAACLAVVVVGGAGCLDETAPRAGHAGSVDPRTDRFGGLGFGPVADTVAGRAATDGRGDGAVPPSAIATASAAAAPAPVVSLGDPVEGHDFTNSVDMTMVWIGPGTFQMGREPPGGTSGFALNATWPVRTVTVRQGFWIAAHEVTQGQFETVMGFNPSRHQGEGLPVEMVTQPQAACFCRLLAERDATARGLASPRAMPHEYRLPSEAQWEYACRAGTTGPCYAVDLRPIAWFGLNSGGTTHPVGTKDANPWKLYDMLGNVEEWCSDGYVDDYRGAPLDERPRAVAGSVRRPLRGGSWQTTRGPACSRASRSGGGPGFRDGTVGFRPVFARPLD